MEEIIGIICRDGVVKLHCLYIMDVKFGPLTTMMLHKLDHLDTLIIDHLFDLDHFLDTLEVQGYISLCPKLTTLALEYMEIPLSAFDDFVHCRTLADSEEPTPGFVTCLKLHGQFSGEHLGYFQYLSQTHSVTIHITSTDDPDPSLEYFPPTMWGY